jgi:hypothetical protein
MVSPSSIARRMIFYVQFAKDPSLLAEHIASVAPQDGGFTREELLVAVDWALTQDDLSRLVYQPHSHQALQKFFTSVIEVLAVHSV